MPKHRMKRIAAGCYRLDDWSVERLEGADRDSYYRWMARLDGMETEGSEDRFRTKSDAVDHVMKRLARKENQNV